MVPSESGAAGEQVQESLPRVLAAGRKAGCDRGLAAVLRRPDEDGARGVRIGRRQPRHDPVDGSAIEQERSPDGHGGTEILEGAEAETARPYRGPDLQQGRQPHGAGQPPRAATLIAGAVVAGHEQADEEGDEILRVGDEPAGKSAWKSEAKCSTEDATLADGPDQQVHGANGGQIGEEQNGEPAGGAMTMTANVGGGAPLEAEADLEVLSSAGSGRQRSSATAEAPWGMIVAAPARGCPDVIVPTRALTWFQAVLLEPLRARLADV